MIKITVDETMKQQLQAARGPMAELRDQSGTLLAVVTWSKSIHGRVPGMSLEDMEAMFTKEQLEAGPDGQGIPMEELIRELEGR